MSSFDDLYDCGAKGAAKQESMIHETGRRENCAHCAENTMSAACARMAGVKADKEKPGGIAPTGSNIQAFAILDHCAPRVVSTLPGPSLWRVCFTTDYDQFYRNLFQLWVK
jgi:hypothetical protein